LWAEKAKTISKSYVHDLLKKFEKYPEEVNKEQKKNLQDHCSQENASV
jgi:polyhydroxyalkanoate synthesis regulator phasin